MALVPAKFTSASRLAPSKLCSNNHTNKSVPTGGFNLPGLVATNMTGTTVPCVETLSVWVEVRAAWIGTFKVPDDQADLGWSAFDFDRDQLVVEQH